jgi:hypothetical protein
MATAETKEEKFVKQLNFSSASLAADWRIFKSQFTVFQVAKKFSKMSGEEQIANLLVLMGPDSVPIYEQFVFDETVSTKKKTLKNVMKMFDVHFEPVKNVIFERMKFNSMKQGDMPIHQFITQLLTQADNCDYGAMKNDLVRDRIVVGVTDDKLRDYLIDMDNLDLQKCVTKAKQYISHHEQSAKIAGDSVDAVRYTRYSSGMPGSSKTSQGVLAPRQGAGLHRGDPGKTKCVWCNKSVHIGDSCPARKSKCHKCGLVGHWAASSVCKGKSSKSLPVKEVQDDMESLFLGSESD